MLTTTGMRERIMTSQKPRKTVHLAAWLALLVVGVVSATLTSSVAIAQGSTEREPAAALMSRTPSNRIFSIERSVGTPTPSFGLRGPIGPSRCWGRSDNPHHSAHEPERVAALSVSSCDTTVVPRVLVFNQLYEKRWFGWDRVGTSGSEIRTNGTNAEATAYWECRDNHFRVRAYHSVTDVDGLIYSARTRKDSAGRIDCSD